MDDGLTSVTSVTDHDVLSWVERCWDDRAGVRQVLALLSNEERFFALTKALSLLALLTRYQDRDGFPSGMDGLRAVVADLERRGY